MPSASREMRSEGSRKAVDHRTGDGILVAGCPRPSTSTLWKPCEGMAEHRWKRSEGMKEGFRQTCAVGGDEGGGGERERKRPLVSDDSDLSLLAHALLREDLQRRLGGIEGILNRHEALEMQEKLGDARRKAAVVMYAQGQARILQAAIGRLRGLAGGPKRAHISIGT